MEICLRVFSNAFLMFWCVSPPVIMGSLILNDMVHPRPSGVSVMFRVASALFCRMLYVVGFFGLMMISNMPPPFVNLVYADETFIGFG